MATIFHLGGYGSGKTYDALLQGIYHELVNGKRGIVTNIALLQTAKVKGKTVSSKSGLGALNDLFNRRFKNLDARILQRVRILDESEVPHFFCHRVSRGGWHYDIPVPDEVAEKRGARPDFSLLRDDGCVFVIDEFHDFFNSRLWAEVGRSVGWYKNQQRKIGDDIHACTPQIDEVDKQLRTIGHEYRVYNNLGLRKVRGIVMPQTFICTVYSSLDAVKRKGQPLNKYPFTLDVELANCYDTAKGVRGLQGGSADIGKRPKGIHWLVPVAIFFAVIFGIIWFSFYARRHLFGSSKPVVTSHSSGPVAPSTSAPARLAPVALASSAAPVAVVATNFSTNEVFCTGWSQLGNIFFATTSDGEIYTSVDHELDWIQKRRVSILGKVYRILVVTNSPAESWNNSGQLPPRPEDAGQIAEPRTGGIQVIPFGNRSQPTPLSQHGFDSFLPMPSSHPN